MALISKSSSICLTLPLIANRPSRESETSTAAKKPRGWQWLGAALKSFHIPESELDAKSGAQAKSTPDGDGRQLSAAVSSI